MRGIADTIARLSAAAAKTAAPDADAPAGLELLDGFGSNPGALGAFVHRPDDLPANAPLVVVLHGCTQSAAGYDRASGWSRLADEHGFALLYPEQRRANNPNGCFNWFDAGDNRRGVGEALSIRQMIDAVRDRHAIDPRRIFVTGLSAGGAMASILLAAYPELFAGGAIIAGLAHGTANTMAQAFDRMRGHGLPRADELDALLRDASGRSGPWPRISVWHGSADGTVDPRNADAIVAQWRGVHGLSEQPTSIDRVDGVPHRSWCDPAGRVLVEDYVVPGMGHGTPLKTHGADAYGASAPYMLDVGISSTLRIAQFWEIVGPADTVSATPDDAGAERATPPAIASRRLHGRRMEPEAGRTASGISKVIEDALRTAGLMK